ncbi:PIN domain-containing protein [Paraburkholderia sp. EG285A]|uniref:PIN domain-containing protein n=1 Tax=Paraburkholderia sp. EG285A TaxID=3237009 RepID=UPI0034D2ECD7
MKNKASDIGGYVYKSAEAFLVDANIWLYLSSLPSAQNAYATNVYSIALKNLILAKSTILISSTIISEFLNRYIRLEWGARHKTTYPDFKDFRKSADFQPVGVNAADEARVILKLCETRDDKFSSCVVDDVLSNFEAGINDFNDGVITHICREYGCKLITHDSDFTTGGIDILTGNNRLLVACPT